MEEPISQTSWFDDRYQIRLQWLCMAEPLNSKTVKETQNNSLNTVAKLVTYVIIE